MRAISDAPMRFAVSSTQKAFCSRTRPRGPGGSASSQTAIICGSGDRTIFETSRPITRSVDHVLPMRSAPHIKTALPGPNATAIIARDRARVSPSYTRDYPFVMARGEGAVVEDVDGNVFLDCAAGIAVTGTGHSHPDVVKAIVDQAHKYLHMSGTDFYYEPQVQLAEDMAAIVPIGARDGEVRSFFSNSGTEAIEAALKLARYVTKRFNIIAFLGSFHGRTLGSLAVTSSKYVQRRGFGPMMPGVFHAPYANCYRCPVGRQPETCPAECLSYVKDQILVPLVPPEEVAAVLVEPIQGEGGY